MYTLKSVIERKKTVMLALLVVMLLVVPGGPAGAALGRPEAAPLPSNTPSQGLNAAATPTATPTASPTAEPTPTETPTPAAPAVVAPPSLPGSPTEQPTTSLEGMLEAFEADPVAPAPTGPNQVQAEGTDTQEIVMAPVAPAPEVQADVPVTPPAEGAVPGSDVAAAGTDVAPEVPAIAPPPIETYGVNVVPSLGTAARPLTNPYSGDPLVLAPLVAGQQVKPNTPEAAAAAALADKAAFLQMVEPVQNVAAASLGVVQPSWFATTLALLVLLVAASYAAVLRRRGEVVPEAIVFTSSVRPADSRISAVRSVRPVDLAGSGMSVRP